MHRFTQAPSVHDSPDRHALPHWPQFERSLPKSTQAELQEVTQALEQVPPAQVAFCRGGGAAHGVQLEPQERVLASGRHCPLHRWNPDTHAKPQAVPSQVAVAWSGTGQAVQLAPQVATLLLEAQAAPQAWKPELQVKPQEVPSQVAVALAGGWQGAHEVPQLATR